MNHLLPEFDFFEEYRDEVLTPRSMIEQLLILDDEIANTVVLSRYLGPVDSFEWRFLKRYYSGLFSEFIIERIDGIVDTTPVEEHSDRFDEFRESIIELNSALPASAATATITLPKPAERLLLKRLRQQRYDPSAIDITYIERGGALYLLELFVTAAQQEASGEVPLLSGLLDETSKLTTRRTEEILAVLRHPVLMLTLWENQRTGLDRWLGNEREGILEMATATGKTVAGIAAIAYICGDLPGYSKQEPETDDATVMVVAHSNAILSQWERQIGDKLGLPISELSGSGRPGTLRFGTGKVEFYTAQSLLPRYDRDLEAEYDLVIYDEVHHYSNIDGFGAAIQRPTYRAALGLSATIGDDGGSKRDMLEELLGDVVYTYGVQDARRDGIIPDFEWTVHPTALDPYEFDEWKKTTKSITNQFTALRSSRETKRILERLSVPFTELEDLGDFIRAHQAAERELGRELPDDWGRLQAAIQSRNWIRHRSQPKLDDAIALAKQYLTEVERGVKVVMFAMDIETTERIADELREISDNVFLAHSKLAGSTKKKDEIVRRQIDGFANADHGVLIAPKLLDEGIDVPDAEVGINVAGTKTKLQLVQRMGRILRKHGDKKPHFHHYVAVPDENFIEDLDAKDFVQELNWVRELGEQIGQQPNVDSAQIDEGIIERAHKRGNELWARDLLNDIGIETVQGTLHLDELIEDLTADAACILRKTVDLRGDEVMKSDWKTAMTILRSDTTLSSTTLQRIWWLFPLYRERPAELDELLREIIEMGPEPTEEAAITDDEIRESDEIETEQSTAHATQTDRRGVAVQTSSDHTSDPDESSVVNDADGRFVFETGDSVSDSPNSSVSVSRGRDNAAKARHTDDETKPKGFITRLREAIGL